MRTVLFKIEHVIVKNSDYFYDRIISGKRYIPKQFNVNLVTFLLVIMIQIYYL